MSDVERMKKRRTNALLPEDIIYYDILIRLPTKYLVRFRSVCKSWKYKLSTSEFIKAHLARHQSSKDQDLLIGQKILSSRMHGVIVISRSKEIYGTAGPSHSDILLGSINGLVCMASGLHFCVWNPAIGQIKEIHFPNHHSKKCEHLLGFSWDHVLDDYKVVIMCYFSKCSSRRLNIYSCKSACWTELVFPHSNAVPDIIIFKTRSEIAPSTIVQGLPYWSYSRSSYAFLRTNGIKASISVFKFVADNNELRLLPHLNLDSCSKVFNLVNVKDCLVGMVYKRGSSRDSLVDMYSLDEETGSGVWSKMYTIGPIDLRNEDLWLSQCFKNGGEILIVETQMGSLSLYDPKTKETKFVRSSYYVFRGCYSYTPSLVCVQGMESMVVLPFQEMKLKKLAKGYKTLIRRSYGRSSSTSSSSSDSDSNTSFESDSDSETD